ncbi:hypothetical protein Tco_1483504, partial [Tanacetum coccineum]
MGAKTKIFEDCGFLNNMPDAEASKHEDASDTGAAPKQQQQVIPQTTAISNIKLPILKKEEYDIWAMEMEHYLEYIDNDVWEEIQAVEKERKAKNILLMAIPKEHMRRFHGMDDAKEIWEAIRTRFGGNANSKKMQKAVFKQQFEGFTISSLKGSLPPTWSNLAMTMRTKPDVDTLSIDDLYNNLRVFEQEIQEDWDLLHEDLEQIDDLDIEEMDINWQIAMIVIRMNKFYKKTGRIVHVDGKSMLKLEARKNSDGLATMDDGIVNWENIFVDEETNHAIMAISSVSECTKEDSVGKPLYNRFIKTNDFKGVPHPLSGDYTPTPQEEIDESLYVYGKKGPQEPEPNVSDDRSSEYSTCQSNDSAGSIGTSSEHSVDPESEISSVPPEVYVSTPITSNEKGVSDPKSKEVEPSCVSHIKTPRQPIKDQATPKVNRKNWNAMMERELGEGYSFTKKKCFVCGSLSHLIKDCDYYEKKMAREAEVKKQRVFNTGNGVAKPVWTNANRVNHANKLVPRSVQLNAGRPNINSVRPNINTGRTNVNPVRPRVNTGSSNVNPVRPRVNTGSSNVNTVRSRQPVPNKTSNSFSPKRPQHKVLFTETEYLVVSSDFKMPDENQILLKVPRHHNMYSFDMKTPTPAKGFACLIAKATSGESKLWHR